MKENERNELGKMYKRKRKVEESEEHEQVKGRKQKDHEENGK